MSRTQARKPFVNPEGGAMASRQSFRDARAVFAVLVVVTLATVTAPFLGVALQRALYSGEKGFISLPVNIYIWMLTGFLSSLLAVATYDGVSNRRIKARAYPALAGIGAVLLVGAVGPLQRYVAWSSDGLHVGRWYRLAPQHLPWSELQRVEVRLEERSERTYSSLTRSTADRDVLAGRFLLHFVDGTSVDVWQSRGLVGFGATPTEDLVSLARAASEAGVEVTVGDGGIDLARRRSHYDNEAGISRPVEVLEAISADLQGQSRLLSQGESGSIDDLRFTLHEVRFVEEAGMFRAGPTKHLLEVTLALGNLGSNPTAYSTALNVRLRSAGEGFEALPLIVSETFGDVPPGESRQARLYFQVPPGQRDLRLTVKGGVASKMHLSFSVTP